MTDSTARARPRRGPAQKKSDADTLRNLQSHDNKAPAEGHTARTDEVARLRASPFHAALRRALSLRGMDAEDLCDLGDPAARRLLAEYGSMFVADARVLVPPRCVFEDEAAVERFQRAAEPRAGVVGGVRVELQPAALEALLEAGAAARAEGLAITPRDGAEAARRTYADTLRLWDSRVRPALEHWSGRSLLGEEEVEHVRGLAPSAQVVEVLRLEAERGIFFSKDFSKSILYSVAAPGASQHLAMLAFDVAEFCDARVRELLSLHGWFQTVRDDLPHFTFLGVREKDLPALGLRRVDERGQTFWVPDLG